MTLDALAVVPVSKEVHMEAVGLELQRISISEKAKWTAVLKDLGWVTAPCAMSLPVFVNTCLGSPNSTEKRHGPSATSSIVRDPWQNVGDPGRSKCMDPCRAIHTRFLTHTQVSKDSHEAHINHHPRSGVFRKMVKL